MVVNIPTDHQPELAAIWPESSSNLIELGIGEIARIIFTFTHDERAGYSGDFRKSQDVSVLRESPVLPGVYQFGVEKKVQYADGGSVIVSRGVAAVWCRFEPIL
jgi:hypothetical protein